MLAFFLDIAAFITGLVIDVADRRKMSEKWKNSNKIKGATKTVAMYKDVFVPCMGQDIEKVI